MTSIPKNYFESSNGEIQVSLHDESSIHLRSITKQNDPVELSSEEARELAGILLSFAERAS
jgi:hypothetical protein